MKYILILMLAVVALPAQAAYWVIDKEVPTKGHIAELTEQDKISLGSYGYVELPDSILDARESDLCMERYNRLITQLKNLDKNSAGLDAKKLMRERERAIDKAAKNSNTCLTKEQKTDTEKESKNVKTNVSLEKRISAMEKQIEKIIKALKSLGAKI